MRITPLIAYLKRVRSLALASFVLIGLLACSEDTPERLAAQRALSIESGAECHLCGMIITNFPGPKGQLYERAEAQSRRFCSTRDMFAYLLDPEHQHNIQSVFVHDMSLSPWAQPDDETFIDARQAWYVFGHGQPGAMGPTLASFADKGHAKAFVEQYKGQIYSFDEITIDLLTAVH